MAGSGQTGLFNTLEKLDRKRFTCLGNDFGRFAFSDDSLQVGGQNDLGMMMLGLCQQFLHPRCVEAAGIEGDFRSLHVDEIFLNLLAMVIKDRRIPIHLITEVTFDDRIILKSDRLVVELHVIFDSLERHENQGTQDRDAHENLESPPLAHFQRSPCEDHGYG